MIKHLPGRTEQELQAIIKNMSLKKKLETGVRQGITWLVRDAIAAGAKVHRDDDWALRSASRYGYTEIVKLLLDAGAEAYQITWALQNASWYGHIEVVKMLLDAGANVHAYNNQALRWAENNEQIEVVNILKQHINEKRPDKA